MTFKRIKIKKGKNSDMGVSRVHRLLRLITLLQGSGSYTARGLADELGVSKRTIFRDLNMLELAHVPYYFDPQKGGYIIAQHFFLPPVNLTITEALSILILTRRMKPNGSVPLLTHATKAAMKLENALPASIKTHVGSVIDRFSFSLGPVADHSGLDATFDELTEAVCKRQICRMAYKSFYEGKPINVTIHPLKLVFIGRAWYMIAYSTVDKDLRTFKLARIIKFTVTKKQFLYPDDVDLNEYFGKAWAMIPEGKMYNVHLHFEPKVAGNVAEVHWHASQRVEFNNDNSAEVYFKVDGLGEITWWILGYGDQVEVISPVALRNRVSTKAKATLKKYQV